MSVTNEQQAQSRIDDIIDGQTRNAVASFDLIEIVRATDREFAVTEVLLGMLEQEVPTQIQSGRDEITRRILESSSVAVKTLGIELVDVQFKRINYTEEVRESVYQRMISERQRIAERSRSEGLGRSAEIRGQKDRGPAAYRVGSVPDGRRDPRQRRRGSHAHLRAGLQQGR